MVENLVAEPRLNGVFHALSHPARRHMLACLGTGEQNVSQLAAPLEMSLAAASKHIRVLESAGLLRRSVRGRTHVCSLAPGPLVEADRWLHTYERHWNERLDRLEALFSQQEDQA